MGVRAILSGRPARWSMVVTWMGIIFFFSSQSSLPSAPAAVLDFIVKKTGHFLEYAILGILLIRAIYPCGQLPRRKLLVPLCLAALYAASDEFHQSFTAGRNPAPLDVGIDTVGAGVGLLVYYVRTHSAGSGNGAGHEQAQTRAPG